MNSSALRPLLLFLLQQITVVCWLIVMITGWLEAGGYGVGYQLLNTSSFDQRELIWLYGCWRQEREFWRRRDGDRLWR